MNFLQAIRIFAWYPKFYVVCAEILPSVTEYRLHVVMIPSINGVSENYLNRPDVALLGYAKFFSNASKEEREHAQKLVDFLTMRGGTVHLFEVKKPDCGFQGPEDILEKSISLEKSILQNLEELHQTATCHNDIVLTDYLEAHFLMEQYKGLQLLAEMLTNVRRAGPGLGLVLLDLELLKQSPQIH